MTPDEDPTGSVQPTLETLFVDHVHQVDKVVDLIPDDEFAERLSRLLDRNGYRPSTELERAGHTTVAGEIVDSSIVPPACRADASVRTALAITRAAEHTANGVITDARQRSAMIVTEGRRRAEEYLDAAVREAASVTSAARQAAQRFAAAVNTDLDTTGPHQPTASSTTPVACSAPRPRPPIDPPAPDVPAIAQAWADALTNTNGYLTTTGPTLAGLLHGYTQRLYHALTGDPFDVACGRRIGTALVAAGVTTPDALGGSLEVLTQALTTATASTAGHRVAALMAALATGYTAALKEDILAAQEAIHRAMYDAAKQATLALRTNSTLYRREPLYDPLTGLANRTLFTERLEQATTRADPGGQIGICLIDLDRFKAVNDRYGTSAGDQVLGIVAQRLRPLVFGGDYTLARLGADEFVIAVEDCAGAAHMAELADRVLTTISRPVTIDGTMLSVTACAGIVVRALGSTAAEQLLRAADTALREAKHHQAHGRSRRIVYDPHPVRPATQATASVTVDPRGFTRTYQPLIKLVDHTVAGFEVATHWTHPNLGRLTADQVIDLTGDRALATPFTAELLHRVCWDATRWRAETAGPYVSVTLPARQINRPNLLTDVRQALDRSALPPNRLQLQIRESELLAIGHDRHAILTTLADLGVRLAVNDVGAGYISLTYLRSLPIAELKLAPELVANLTSTDATPTDTAIIKALVDVAHTLGLSIAAQSVDTEYLARQLTHLRCDSAQGRYFGEPQPPDKIDHPRVKTGRAPGRTLPRRTAGRSLQLT